MSEALTFRFRARHSWALLPYKPRIDAAALRRGAELYEQEFRWQRGRRRAGLCRPWRLAQELGWCVPSPVDVTLTPIEGHEVTRDSEALGDLARLAGQGELWRREDSALLLDSALWLRFHQYRTDDGWQSMFIPNGEGSAEWKLGWDVDVPPDFCLMVLPWQLGMEPEVPMGLLDAKTLQRFRDSDGMSIAIRPVEPVRIVRGQPVARLIPVHRSALQVQAMFEEKS